MLEYRALLQQRSAWPRVLGVITCKILRTPQDPYIQRLEEVIETVASDKFCEFVVRNNLHIVATGGSYDRLNQFWRQHDSLKSRRCRVQPSAAGVIQIANLVVFGFCRAILFFNDSDDLYADSPQNLALRRICNEFNVPLVEDLASIRFLLNRWYAARRFRVTPSHTQKRPQYPEDALELYFGDDREIRDFGTDDRVDRSHETLAVIAHNDKKMEMLRFCAKHIYEILSYRRVLTTGTTGEKLRGLYKELLLLSDEMRARFKIAERDAIPEFVDRKICPFKSGPDGGDIQISSKIIEGSCHRVIFFQDPKSAHPHQFDVRLLEKSVQSHSTSTLFATSTEMAELIV